MHLWIGEVVEGGGRELRLEGRLVGEVVAELEKLVQSPQRPDRIDLDQLFAADEFGIRLLRRLASEGVALIGARPLIEHRLKEDPEEARR